MEQRIKEAVIGAFAFSMITSMLMGFMIVIISIQNPKAVFEFTSSILYSGYKVVLQKSDGTIDDLNPDNVILAKESEKKKFRIKQFRGTIFITSVVPFYLLSVVILFPIILILKRNDSVKNTHHKISIDEMKEMEKLINSGRTDDAIDRYKKNIR